MSADIIDRVARIIDPSAFVDWTGTFVSDEKGTRPYRPSRLAQSRINFKRAQARHRAEQVLALLVAMQPDELRRQFLDAEVAGWKELGLDHPSVREMVAAKHGIAVAP